MLHLEDGPGVVAHPAHQGRVEHEPEAAGRLRLDRVEDALQATPHALVPPRPQEPTQRSRRRARGQEVEQAIDRAGGVPGLPQLGRDAVPADLVELVERDEHRARPLRIEPAVGDQAPEEAPVVDPHRQVLEPQRGERLGGGQDQLDLRDLGCHPQDVDVALGELPVATLLRPLRPPHRADLDGLERLGQARVIVRVVADERHREVEPQAQVGQVLRAARRRELLPALQDPVDQLFILPAVAPEQQAEALHRGRLDADEAVPPVDGQDLGHGPVTQCDFVGEHVPHAAGR